MKKMRIICLIIAVVLLFAIAGCGNSTGSKTGDSASTGSKTDTKTGGESKAKPTKISIIDGSGEEILSHTSFDLFVKENPDLVSGLDLISATAPEMVSKVKAQQSANNIDTTIIFIGYDGVCAGIEEGIFEKLLPDHKDKLPTVEESFLDIAKMLYEKTGGYAFPHSYSTGGPMFTYNPDKIKEDEVPSTLEELLEWAKANPGKFMYARPYNSGAGYAWLQGLPYLLDEKDPNDPESWERVWPYLQELGKYIEYYPTSTGVTFKELAEGTRYAICSAVGYETNQRALGTIPSTFKQGFYDNTVWVADANYVCIPKGLDEQRLNTSLAFIDFLMTREQQAYLWDSGYMYPGPAVKDVPLSMAPQESQDILNEVLTKELLAAIEKYPSVPPMDSEPLVKAFDMWDKLVGSGKTK